MIAGAGKHIAGHEIAEYLDAVRGFVARANEFAQGATEVLAHGTGVKLK